MASEESGSWRGSVITEHDLGALRSENTLGKAEEVALRPASAGEVVPNPGPGERVVFADHLDRGFALPVSPFFRELLDFYGL